MADSRCVRRALLLCVLALPVAWLPLRAQEAPEPVPVPEAATAQPEEAAADSARGPSPGGAFLRSILVPGWGQASHGAYVRGGVFFALQAGSGFMLVKTLAKLAEARQIEESRVAFARAFAHDSLLARAADDPALAARYAKDPRQLELDVQKAVDADSSVVDIRGLVGAREQQREDWIALALFTTLMSGVDALVNAHLADFPGRVEVQPVAGGGVSIGMRLPAGGKP